MPRSTTDAPQVPEPPRTKAAAQSSQSLTERPRIARAFSLGLPDFASISRALVTGVTGSGQRQVQS